ncbi:predicted protein [Lichtheimia corymbifera JMRC:FSU:9682]|uniref:Uncharacterized protein n=1 Tax=Lichtheimia corymbifera JMRC:FSU:9682 TaxID=1263082 RepID=A0A068RUT5_9FUNG|nr:predicted protein [Lichtheimia corymbifera JMRC:FSU:9682]
MCIYVRVNEYGVEDNGLLVDRVFTASSSESVIWSKGNRQLAMNHRMKPSSDLDSLPALSKQRVDVITNVSQAISQVPFLPLTPPLSHSLHQHARWRSYLDDPTRGKREGSHQTHVDQWFHLMLVYTTKSKESYYRTTFSQGIARRTSRDDDGDHKEDVGGNKDLVVETVGFGKIEREQRNLSNFKVVGLADQQINTAGEAGVIAEHHLSTHDLDLSKNLLRSWDALSEIKKQLPELIILRLNHCRLELPSTSIDHAAFSSITTLGLSSTKTPWLTVMQLSHYYLVWKTCSSARTRSSICLNPTTIDFHILNAPILKRMKSAHGIAKLGCLRSLDILYLNGNKIPWIQPIEANTFPKLEFLRVDNNQIKDRESLDILNALPSLRRLRCKGNPIVAPLSREQGIGPKT